jgi:ribonucleoside-triphosphate reductase
MFKSIRKRDGRLVDFNESNIVTAIAKAGEATGEFDARIAETLADRVLKQAIETIGKKIPTVEQIQDIVENVLMASSHKKTAKAYILYRQERERIRNSKSRLMSQYQVITGAMAKDSSDLKRSNANVDGDTAMGKMLQYGAEGAKEFALNYLLKPAHALAHLEGDIHIHDLDFLPTGTLTCCQTDILELFSGGGFSTGHGFLRTPNSIGSYAALAAIILQANQNEQHGGQSIPNFDYAMADGINKTYRKAIKINAEKYTTFTGKAVKLDPDQLAAINYDEKIKGLPAKVFEDAQKDTIKQTYQAMEGLVHNLNTMHSRAGAQVPFTSLNFGTDTTPAGRLATEQFLLATEAGLGRGETPIFPISIFKVKEGVNYNPADPNYDLFKLAMRVSAKRLFPNFVFVDAPFNLQYYKPGDYKSEIATMGCRTRVFSSIFPESDGRITGRGNTSFTTINLPRIGLHHGIALGERKTADWKGFYRELDEKIDLAADQLLERFQFQSEKTVKNFPFLMGQGVWMNSNQLKPNDKLREVIKHGSLSIGFIGLAETLVAMMGEHHGESAAAQKRGIEIVTHFRKRLDTLAKKRQLNYTLLATPAEGLAGRFTRIDAKEFGVIPGVTDREFYTNSFHVPVYYKLGAFDKIDLEAPYHALCNAGHITYVELDGDPSKNLDAFEAIIRHMKDANIGYGSVNHPVDRDPVCGFSGIIDGARCPACGREETVGEVGFERLRRITGYLVGSLDRWNDAKQAEEKARVKHAVATPATTMACATAKDEREYRKSVQAKALGKA